MTPAQMNAALATYSARAEPIIPEGWKVPNGYILRGPRGNKKVIGVDHNGNITGHDEWHLRFWLECIADGDARDARRKSAARASGL